MARRYAHETSVPVSKSRGQIDTLLRQWGCRGVQWTDEFDDGLVMLRFMWEHADNTFMARLSLKVPTDEDLMKDAVDGRDKSGKTVSTSKLEKLRQARGQSEHRILLLWLKAAFNAVDAGLLVAEEMFLPFLEGKDGRTVAEVAIPRIADLIAGSAGLLLKGVD